MKCSKWLGSAFLVSVIGIAGLVRPANAAQLPTPVLEYRFEEGTGTTATNTGSYLNANGTLNGAATRSTDVPPGVTSNSSLSLIGQANTFVSVPDNFRYTTDGSATTPRLTQLTIEAWIKPTAVDGQRLVWDDYWSPGVLLAVSSGVGQMSVSTDSHPGGGISNFSGQVLANTWQHLAGVYDGSRLRLYINGRDTCATVQTSGGIIDQSSVVPGVPAFIGIADGSGLFFAGLIDDLRIFPVALTRNQLANGFFATTPEIPCAPPPVTSSLCGPNTPSRISGSTGAQGVLDPANTIPPTQTDGGLVWPGAAVLATLFLDTGLVVFTDAGNQVAGTAVLPGVSGYPAFPEGKLNFTNVRLPAGKGVVIVATASTGALFGSELGVAPAALLLSCQDVVLEAGSLLAVGTVVTGAPILQATATPVVMPGGFPGGGAASTLPAGGLGPRLAGGAGPAAGSLYPAWGGAGGASGSTPITCGLGSVVCPSGGFGGGALVVAAAQKITVNGTIQAVGSNAAPNSAGAQGGAGGSVRLAAVLVEGIGTINTAGGSGGAAGPIEIQGFVQNLFSGTLTGSATPCTTNKDCPVVAPLPSNLPTIEIVGVEVGQSDYCGFECANTGSLVDPDVELLPAATVESVTVTARLEFQSCLASAPTLTLAFRAVGTDGSAQDKSASAVAGTSCTTAAQTPGVQDVTASAVVDLTPGVSYQIVVTPAQAFALPQREAGVGWPVAGVASQPGLAQEAAREVRAASPAPARAGTHSASSGQAARERSVEGAGSERLLEQWSRLFGVEAPAGKRVARLSVAVRDQESEVRSQKSE